MYGELYLTFPGDVYRSEIVKLINEEAFFNGLTGIIQGGFQSNRCNTLVQEAICIPLFCHAFVSIYNRLVFAPLLRIKSRTESRDK